MAVFFILGIIMTTQITLQLDLTTDTTGNAEQVAQMIGVSAWHISGDYLIVEDPLLAYKTDVPCEPSKIVNGAVVTLIQHELKTPEQKIEHEIQAKGLNAPRLTPNHIDSKIKSVEYILPRDVCKRDNGVEIFDAPLPLQALTFCILTLENGFTVTGESACASPENFDAEIGKKIAYDNAREKIWLLEGYLLKEKLHQAAQDNTKVITLDDVKKAIVRQHEFHSAIDDKYVVQLKLNDGEVITGEHFQREQAIIIAFKNSSDYLQAKEDANGKSK